MTCAIFSLTQPYFLIKCLAPSAQELARRATDARAKLVMAVVEADDGLMETLCLADFVRIPVWFACNIFLNLHFA